MQVGVMNSPRYGGGRARGRRGGNTRGARSRGGAVYPRVREKEVRAAGGGGGFSRDTGGKGAAVYPGVREKGGIRRGLVVRVPRVAGYLKGGV